MNRFAPRLLATTLMASAVLAVAMPAAAQSYSAPSYQPQGGYSQGGYGPGYNQGGYNQSGYNQSGYNQGGYNQGGYGRDNDGRSGQYGYDDQRGGGDFTAQLERLTRRVSHGVDDGRLSPWQGRRLFGEIGGLRRLERAYRMTGGRIDGRERMDLQARLDQVRGSMGGGYGGGRDDNDDGWGWGNDRDERGPRR